MNRPPEAPGYSSVRPSAANSSDAAPQGREVDPQWRKYVDSPGLVLASCFLALAVFGIPLIFMCRKFSPAMKIFWTAVVLLYTALLLAGFFAVMYWVWLQISGAF